MNQKNVFAGKRKYYFINEYFQIKDILKVCFLVVVGCVIFAAIIYLFSKQTMTTSFENSRLVLKSTADFIFPALVSSMIVVITVLSIICLIVVLFASQNIIRPMCILAGKVKDMGEGDLTLTINSTAQVEMGEVVGNFNEMLEKLKSRILQIKGINGELGENIEKLRKIRGTCSQEEAKLIEELLKKQEEISERLAYFKTESKDKRQSIVHSQ